MTVASLQARSRSSVNRTLSGMRTPESWGSDRSRSNCTDFFSFSDHTSTSCPCKAISRASAIPQVPLPTTHTRSTHLAPCAILADNTHSILFVTVAPEHRMLDHLHVMDSPMPFRRGSHVVTVRCRKHRIVVARPHEHRRFEFVFDKILKRSSRPRLTFSGVRSHTAEARLALSASVAPESSVVFLQALTNIHPTAEMGDRAEFGDGLLPPRAPGP